MAPKNTPPASTPQGDACKPTYGTPARPREARPVESTPTTEYAQSSSATQTPKAKESVNTNAVNKGGAANSTPAPAFEKPNNAYAHESNNTVPNSKANDGGTDFEKVNLNLQFLPNVLDNYDVVTYHWKLFITDPDTSSTGAVLNQDRQIIIAESGVTDLTIDKVEIISIATPSIESGTGVSTSVKFEITEPSGAGLVDKLFYQSVALGIGNWAVMPIYLQLQFRGRYPETSNPEDGDPGTLSSMKWLWALKITRIKANVTHVGTKYEFDAIIYNDFAQSNAVFTLQHNVVLNDLDTFADAMEKLQNKLNADQTLKLINNYSIKDTFKIVVDPKIAGFKITPPDNNTNPIRNNNFDYLEFKDGTFTSGTSIDKIIDTLLAQTSEYQEGMLGAPTPGAEGASMNEVPSQMKKFWRIITETRPLKFDPRRQDIAKEFTIFVIEYDIGILDSNVFQTSSPPLTIEAERKRLMTYVNKAILKKKYNYIFTGLNDQVINFDLTINNAYAASQARFGGIYANPSMYDTGIVTHDHVNEEAAVAEALSRAISFMNDSKASPESTKESEETAKKAIEAAKLPDERKREYRVLLETAKLERSTEFRERVAASENDNEDEALIKARNEANYLSRPVTETVTQKQLRFISDVDIRSSKSQNAYTKFMENSRGKLRPIARVETLQDRQVGLGIEGNSNSGIQKLSSMFSVALHSGLDSSFTRIRLTIKGDPFWLFPNPMKDDDRLYNSLRSPAIAIDNIKNSHKREVDSANLYGTDNFMIIRFRSPRVYNIDDDPNGDDPITDVETFSGVYKVIRIVSKFALGKFEQEMECTLDPEIRILNIADQIEDNARKKDTKGKPGDLTETVSSVPESAVKQDRLQGASEEPGVDATSNENLRQQGSRGPQIGSNTPTTLTNVIPGFPNILE